MAQARSAWAMKTRKEKTRDWLSAICIVPYQVSKQPSHSNLCTCFLRPTAGEIYASKKYIRFGRAIKNSELDFKFTSYFARVEARNIVCFT